MTDTTYARWARGDCPCCSGPLLESVDGTECAAIGEGVMICGRCIEHEHHHNDGLPEVLLAAILYRHDGPVDDWVEQVEAEMIARARARD